MGMRENVSHRVKLLLLMSTLLLFLTLISAASELFEVFDGSYMSIIGHPVVVRAYTNGHWSIVSIIPSLSVSISHIIFTTRLDIAVFQSESVIVRVTVYDPLSLYI